MTMNDRLTTNEALTSLPAANKIMLGSSSASTRARRGGANNIFLLCCIVLNS
jgi:hypothetical protein